MVVLVLGLAVLIAVVILALKAVDTTIVLALITLLTSIVVSEKDAVAGVDHTRRDPRPFPGPSQKLDRRPSSTSPIPDAAAEGSGCGDPRGGGAVTDLVQRRRAAGRRKRRAPAGR